MTAKARSIRAIASSRRPGERVEPPEPPEHAGGGMRVALLLVQLDRLLEQPARRVRIAGSPGHLARAVEKRRPLRRILRELRRLLEVAPRLCGRGERRGALAGAREHRLRLASDLGGVVRVRGGLVGGEVVRGDHLDHLVLVGGERRAQVTRPRRGASHGARASRASRRRRGGRGPAGSRTGRAPASAGRPERRAPPCARGT